MGTHGLEYLDDCLRIQEVLTESFDKYFTLPECEELWEYYSETEAAGWLCLPEDTGELIEIMKCVLQARADGWIAHGEGTY